MLPIGHLRLDFWVPLLQLSGFPSLHEQQVTTKNKTWQRLVQFTAILSAFAWVRVTTQSHYCTTPYVVFTLLFNLVSTGLTAGFGVRVASTRSARSSLALGNTLWPGTEVFSLLCNIT